MATLRNTLRSIKDDLPNSKFTFRLFLFNYLYNPGFRILLNYRLGRFFSQSKYFLVRVIGSYYRTRLIVKRNCHISYRAHIGKNLKLPHPLGIVIGDDVVIKDNVMIFQQVTLGSHGKKGQPLKYPVVESGAKIYAGAKIIGGVTIGENAVIGANSLINIDVPSGMTAVGTPCKILNK